MKIVILGAGAVGSTLASLLCQENDLVVVDQNSSELHRLEEETDIIRNSIKNVKNKTELIDIFKNSFGN